MDDESERLAAEMARIREEVREKALLEPPPALGEPRAAPRAAPLPAEAPAEEEPLPPRPDAQALNAGWDVRRVSLRGLVRRLIAPLLDAQAEFNARQVQLDNALLDHLAARLDATHRHYDRVLGLHARRMGEIDERHLILQEELVAHVHDLVRRIDLVLSESERGRLGLEHALREVRARLKSLEERVRRE